MKHNRHTALCLALAAAGMASQTAFATDGYFANGYGMKSIGMGGAAVAVAQEPFGGAVNPGAMSFLGNEWQLGAVVVQPAPQRLAHGLGPRQHRRLRRQRQHQLLHPRVRRQLEVQPGPRARRHRLRQRRDEHRLPGRADLEPERVHEFPRRRPVRAVQPAVRHGQPRRRPDAADDRAVRVVAVRQGPVGRRRRPVIAYQRFKAEGLQAFDNPIFSTSRGTSPTTATTTPGASACASATWASSPTSSRSAPPGRARPAWASSTSTRGCSRSRAASTFRRTSPSGSRSGRRPSG